MLQHSLSANITMYEAWLPGILWDFLTAKPAGKICVSIFYFGQRPLSSQSSNHWLWPLNHPVEKLSDSWVMDIVTLILDLHSLIWRGLFQNALMSLQCQCQLQRLCFGKEHFTYLYMHIYVCIFIKNSFPNLDLPTCNWHCDIDFWIGA